MTKVHLDTDLGGDIDDICALAMLLRWPGVEIVGITVVGDTNGKRTGYTRYVLQVENRTNIPVLAGAEVSGGFFRYPKLGLPVETKYWPKPIKASPNKLEEAIELLKASIEKGALVVAIGPFTNLYLLDNKYPGILRKAKLFLMGGYVYPIRNGFPQWSNNYDWNIQADIKSAKHVLEHSNPTLIPLTVTVETALRRAYINKLQKAGALGQLLARQALSFAEDELMETKYGATCVGLPKDIINFLHDPLACAIALGYHGGVEIQELPLIFEEKSGWLFEQVEKGGKSTKVVTRIDGNIFSEFWFNTVTKKVVK